MGFDKGTHLIYGVMLSFPSEDKNDWNLPNGEYVLNPRGESFKGLKLDVVGPIELSSDEAAANPQLGVVFVIGKTINELQTRENRLPFKIDSQLETRCKEESAKLLEAINSKTGYHFSEKDLALYHTFWDESWFA